MGFPINEAGVEEVWGDRAHFAVKDFYCPGLIHRNVPYDNPISLY